jgi:uncharacterized coiled-coil DUF342 family protein
MNKERRNRLNKLAHELLELNSKLEDLVSEIETLRDEEQEYHDNMPEALQGGEKGEAANEAINNMDDCLSELENAKSNFDTAHEYLSNSTA